MTSVNRVILTGTVVTPPQRHYRPDGSPVIQFPLELIDPEDPTGHAPNRNGTGQRSRNRVEIVAIGELAEMKLDLLQSGQPLMVIGKLNQRCWRTPEGRNRTCTEVIATTLRTIENKSQQRKSTLPVTEPKVDGCSDVSLKSGKPGLQRRNLQLPKGSKKQGE